MVTKPDIKIIGVGMSRTGTLTLCQVLDMLGFGPCFHPLTVPIREGHFKQWARLAKGDTSPENLENLLKGFHAVLDAPAAIAATQLFEAYPNAKYILTVRDPEKWKASFDKTVRLSYLNWMQGYYSERKESNTPDPTGWDDWCSYQLETYHDGRLMDHTMEEYHTHNERIKTLIPPKQLLIYDLSEGWDKLVEFLGVPKPSEPFPHKNEGQGSYMHNIQTIIAATPGERVSLDTLK